MGLSVSSFLVLPSNQLPLFPVLTVTRNAGFTGAVALTTTGLPLTLAVAYSPNNLTGTTASLLILDLGGTPPGTYTATIRGVAAGGLGERTLTFQVVVAAATPGNIHWKFCSGSTPQYFFAVKDGTGPWTRIMPSVDSVYSFNIASATASVATVTVDSGGYRTTVYQYTAAELAARAASQCALVQNSTTRTANGSFAGVTGFRTSQVGMGWWFGSANGNGSFSLLNLPPGPLDVVAMRNGDISAQLEIPVDRAIIRRGVNPASGATLPVLDFNAAESFAPTTATWTFNNVNAGEQMSMSQSFFTAGGTTGFFSLYPGVDRAQTVRTIYGIPLAQMITGDLHQVVATINTVGIPAAAPNRGSRQIIAYARSLAADRTIAFGPAMPAPTRDVGPRIVDGRLRAAGTLPTEYSAGVSFDVTQTTTARFATVHTTRDFLNTAGTYDVQIPDLTAAIGWDTQFAIRAGVSTNWWVSGGGPVLDFYDARYIFNSTHSRWTGAQTGIVGAGGRRDVSDGESNRQYDALGRGQPNGARCRTARETTPNADGAECQTAPNARRRRMPDDAECQMTPNARRRRMPDDAELRNAPNHAVCAIFGISRRSAFRAVRHSAPFGIPRRSAFCAVRHSAPSVVRRSAFCAVRHLAPFSSCAVHQLRVVAPDPSTDHVCLLPCHPRGQ